MKVQKFSTAELMLLEDAIREHKAMELFACPSMDAAEMKAFAMDVISHLVYSIEEGGGEQELPLDEKRCWYLLQAVAITTKPRVDGGSLGLDVLTKVFRTLMDLEKDAMLEAEAQQLNALQGPERKEADVSFEDVRRGTQPDEA